MGAGCPHGTPPRPMRVALPAGLAERSLRTLPLLALKASGTGLPPPRWLCLLLGRRQGNWGPWMGTMEKHRPGSADTALVSRCTATGCCQRGTREPKPLTTTRAGQKGPGDREDRRRGLWCCSSRGRDERGAWPEHGEPRHHPTPPDKPSRGIKSILCSRSRDFRASPVAIETRLPELLLIVIPAVPSFLPALPSSHALAPGAGSPPAPRPPLPRLPPGRCGT